MTPVTPSALRRRHAARRSAGSCRCGSVPGWPVGICTGAPRIEQTAGPRESLVHHLMFGETGVPALTAHRVTADEDQPGAREPEAGHDLRRHPGGAQDEQAAQEI